MTQNFNLANAHLCALDAPTAQFNFRAIHDQDKAKPAIKRRGTLQQHWQELCDWNNKGYGIFVTPSEMDGSGYDASGFPLKDENGNTKQGDLLSNVTAIRAHYVDLDSLTAMHDLQRASGHFPPPQFMVQSSPNKAHVYWILNPSQRYQDNGFFNQLQRKLAQLYNGDSRVHDATRVMRLSGFYHCKGAPHLVTCASAPGWGAMTDPGALAQSVAHVNVVQHGGGLRKPLGTPELAAPSMEWVTYALSLADPNDMDRDEWISFTAAIKQAMSTLVEPEDSFRIWSAWCERYTANDPGENLKQWNDLSETQVGWSAIERKFPTINAYRKLGAPKPPVQPLNVTTQDQTISQLPKVEQSAQSGGMPQIDQPAQVTASQSTRPQIAGDILTAEDQAIWFEGCNFISNLGLIMDRKNRFMSSTQFNADYGGKIFILDDFGKTTDEPWKAATRGRVFTVPKYDHIRFLPNEPFGSIHYDELGREGFNAYRRPVIDRIQGDPSLFLNHMQLMLPNENDRHLLFSYMAHNAQYPGFKIPWAPFIQSAEGVGKGVLKLVMRHAVGRSYFYSPKAKELAESGAKFNAWMRAKLFILVDEIKVDEKRDLMETLKPMISEEEIEVQAKGHDQDLEDNFSNWLFFSNWQNAFPLTRNGRRIAPFFSPIQTVLDLRRNGMNEAYFTRLYDWLKKENGCAIVYDWLMRYPVERGSIPMRAPETSTTEIAIQKSRGNAERLIAEAIEDEREGFKGGWVSSIAVDKLFKERGQRHLSKIAVDEMLTNLGYYEIGRSPRSFFQEEQRKPYLYATSPEANLMTYGATQGYGS